MNNNDNNELFFVNINSIINLIKSTRWYIIYDDDDDDAGLGCIRAYIGSMI